MKEIIIAVLSAVLVKNVVLSGFFGVTPMFGVKKNARLAVTIFSACILFLTAFCTWVLNTYVLAKLEMAFAPVVVAIILSVIFGLIGDIFMKGACGYKENRKVYLIIAVLNAAVIGAMTAVLPSEGILDAALASLYAAVGFFLANVIFGAVRGIVNDKFAPKAFRGLPLDLLTAGLMALCFMAFA